MYYQEARHTKAFIYLFFGSQNKKNQLILPKNKRERGRGRGKRGEKCTNLINKLFGEVFQFGTVVADEVTIRVEFFAELDGRIDAKVLLEVGRSR